MPRVGPGSNLMPANIELVIIMVLFSQKVMKMSSVLRLGHKTKDSHIMKSNVAGEVLQYGLYKKLQPIDTLGILL